MILKYGAYAHAGNEVQITISRRANIEPNGLRSTFVETWHIRGVLQAASQAALTAALGALEAAYAVDGNTLAFFEDDGTTETAHKLDSATAIGGVRVVAGPSYPAGSGAEYSTFRTYTVTVEAEYPLDDEIEQPVAWTETLLFGGGGPRFVMLHTLTGTPVKQEVAENTPYWCLQTGSARGLLSYPAPPEPLFPGDEHVDRRRIAFRTPEILEGVPKDFVVEWSYSFEATGALVGMPTIP
jgi:hypothetical protein